MLWDALFSYAKGILVDGDIAKDMVQDVLVDYWNRRKTIEPRQIKSYLYKAVRFRCYKYLRDNKLDQLQLEVIKDLDFSITNEYEVEENVRSIKLKIQDSISDMPDRCQEIYKLSRVHHHTNADIANRLNISKRTVENQLSSALGKLRKDLYPIQ